MISRSGSGPQDWATLYTFPEIPAGVALVAAIGTVSGGNVDIKVSAFDSAMDLTGGVEVVRNQMLLADPGHVVEYRVRQDIGQTVVWAFELFVGLPTDISQD